MKNLKLTRVLFGLALVLALVVPSVVRAVPYASAVNISGGTVSFVLNESADNVKVVFTSPNSTTDLGALAKGTYTFPRGAAASFKIQVTKSAPPVWTQISADTNKFCQYFAPVSVSVNRNPASTNFGRVYILETIGGTTGTGRLVTEGIFAVNADLTDAFGLGDTGSTGGLDGTYDIFSQAVTQGGSTDRYDPFQIEVGEDDNVYIADANDPRGGVYRTTPDLLSGEIVLEGKGNIAAPTIHTVLYGIHVKGNSSTGNLTIWCTDGQWVQDATNAYNSVLRWDIGSGALPYNTPPTFVANPGSPTSEIDSDLDVAPDGNIFTVLTAPSGTSAVKVFSSSGALLWSSPTDVFTNAYSLEVSPDNTKAAIMRRDRTTVIVALTNGPSGRLPDTSATNLLATFTAGTSSHGRAIHWDAAGNLYAANRATEQLRVFSPGGTTTANTGSDGTFNITVPQTTVTISNNISSISEGVSSNIVFTVSRSGNTADPLTVSFLFTGTATNGVDCSPAIPASITFPGGVVTSNITVTITDDSVAELSETLTVALNSGTNYSVGTPGSATTTILDNESPEVSVGLVTSENRLLEGYSYGKVAMQLVRKGLLTSAVTVNLTYSGTATAGSDYTGPSSVSLPASAVNAAFSITSLNDSSYEGSETAIVGTTSGSGYSVGSGTATANVIDDEVAAGSVLFSDNFNTASSDTSTNWTINSQDGFVDSHADFGFDYTTLGVPALPGGSDTLGLRLRCNQTASPRNCISLSPLGLNLGTNDYRLRFNMWINYNGPMFDGGSGSTFHVDAGVGTTGDHPNFQYFASADGIWFSIDGDGGAGGSLTAGDCNIYNGVTLLTETSGFYAAGTTADVRVTANPYYSLWGGNAAPAAQVALYPGQTGTSGSGNMGVSWHSVVVTKVTNIVEWKIDGVVIGTVTNDPTTLSTNVFIGYHDQFLGSISSIPDMSFAVIDDLKVETYSDAAPVTTGPTITSVSKSGGNLIINFTGSAGDTAGSFSVVGSTTLSASSASYTAVAGSNVTGGSGTFQATVPMSGTMKFIRIKR